MGTKRRRNSKRHGAGGANDGRRGTKTDVLERAVLGVIERERRNLQRASAVLAALSVAVGRDERDIDAGDVADVARHLIDGRQMRLTVWDWKKQRRHEHKSRRKADSRVRYVPALRASISKRGCCVRVNNG